MWGDEPGMPMLGGGGVIIHRHAQKHDWFAKRCNPSAPNTLLGSVFRHPKPTPNPLAEGSSEHKGKVNPIPLPYNLSFSMHRIPPSTRRIPLFGHCPLKPTKKKNIFIYIYGSPPPGPT